MDVHEASGKEHGKGRKGKTLTDKCREETEDRGKARHKNEKEIP